MSATADAMWNIEGTSIKNRSEFTASFAQCRKAYAIDASKRKLELHFVAFLQLHFASVFGKLRSAELPSRSLVPCS